MKKNAIMFNMNALAIPSTLRLAQSQYQNRNPDKTITSKLMITITLVPEVSSIHFSMFETFLSDIISTHFDDS